MPNMKGKGASGGSTAQRYRPASEYDDATLAQKREYWRTKKREQRARLSERRATPKRDGRGEEKHKDASAAMNSSLASSNAVSSAPLQNSKSYKTANVSHASLCGNGVGKISVEASQSQKERWFQTIKLNKVLPQFPASSSISAKTAVVRNAAVKCLSTGSAVSRSVTSPKPSGTLFKNSSSVPPIRVTMRPSGSAPSQPQGRMTITNGSSSKATPQPCLSMQGTSVPKAQRKAQVAVRIQPKPLTTNVITGKMPVSSASAPVPFKVEGRAANTTPQAGKKSAFVDRQRAKGINNTQANPESEEERAAKRREQWRIKKREQRAKQAAKLAKTRERTQSTELTLQRQMLQRTGQPSGVLKHLPSPSSLRGAWQRQCATRAKTSFTSAGRLLKNARVIVASSFMPQHTSIAVKKEIDNLQSDAVKLTTVNPNWNQQAVQIKTEGPRVDNTTKTTDVMIEKKPGEPSRKFPTYIHFSNASRGIIRCKTPRQRFIETQRSFLSQRNMRGKFPSHAAVFNSRNAPKIYPNETPEQTAARRREYWRIKKREQRAKLSVEVKNKLKEKDSLMRRVKRYQKILEEMRRARAEACSALTQPTGSTHTHASETIGGFIKEDGTVTINIPTDPAKAANKIKEEVHLLSNNTVVAHPQNQPHTKARSNATKGVVLGDPIRANRPPPPLRPAQVKVSLPHTGQSSKPPRLLSIRPRTQLERTVTNSHTLVVQNSSQITLTHPQTLQCALAGASTAGSSIGGCVMKMAVSSPAMSIAAPCLDPELSEEERMAKKREYWRVKKREQRAARAARLKQGFLLARGNAALQRRKIQKLASSQKVVAANLTPGRNITNHAVNIQPLPNSRVPITPKANEIKEDRESTPAVDLNSQPEQAICPDIKPPPSPPPLPGPQPESDPALSAESQATTLLAVASMKKLLEESLSTVTECQSEHAGVQTEHLSCKTEAEGGVSEEAPEQETKSNMPVVSLGGEDKVPIDADLTLEIKSWQADVEASKTLDPLPSPTEDLLRPPSERSPSPTPSFSCASAEALDGPVYSPLRRAQRLRTRKAGHQHCCSPEPPKLHHLPLDEQHPSQQQQHQQQPIPQPQHCEQRCQPSAQQCEKNSSAPTQQQQQHPTPVAEQGSMNSLQKKREYWKLMKRQQRARSKARQKEGLRHGESGRRLSPKNIQAPNLVIINHVKSAQGASPPTKPALQPKPSTATLTTVHSIPTLLVVSPTSSNVGQSPDTLQVKPPISSAACSPVGEQNEMPVEPDGGDAAVPPSGSRNDGRLRLVENPQGAMKHSAAQPRVRKWTLQEQESADEDAAPALPTLTPPDNPLSSINLLPIEPFGQTPSCTATLSPIKISRARPQSPQNVQATPTKLVPISTMAPPKRVPGESEEEFLRRKREYWRVKKKEQRARKAIRDRELTQRRASNNWRPILPAQGQGQETQDSDQWVNSSEESEQLMSTSSEAELGYFTYSSYTEPIEDESDVLFNDYDDDNGEDGPISDAVWRNRYLMDHDPLNQLLVCMVCGDLQYSHSLEGVRAHIEEAHPDTLNLEAPERKRILEAWDEQVSQRERFFTSQLQQRGGALAEAHRT